MSNDYLSLIANLNSESPVMSSQEDYSAELSLWTNLQFTYDAPPGLGIFEQDSGFDALSALNTPAHHGITTAQQQQQQQPVVSAAAPAPVAATKSAAVGHNPQSALDQKHLMEYLNLPQEDARPLSLLERTRQRNPVNANQPQSLPELQEQAAAINAFHSLLAAYSASAQVQQQQQLQQPQLVQQQQQQRQTSSGLPLLLPNIAPATAPTTPAAAKLLRQPLPQYKAAPSAKKALKAIQTPAAIAPAGPIAPKSPTTVSASAIAAAAAVSAKATSTPLASPISESKDEDETETKHELSAADSFSKDDPEYLSKVAAEEDKRRRNTAASARFRYKKKLREQALEQTAKEQTLRAETLEARVKELEMEVKWLRGLIVEKDSHLHEVTASIDESSQQGSNKRIKLDAY
ncbi:hypothetical protein BKA57DRAFT_463703 [Linnemannia elongata]|nr:hypothetical protein BGZ88_006306 [Linnemannia elongata]KAH7047918.1 hypothetical protein BKA57DRAFT_463703 [Linnemannia elongata]KAK5821876.1 hypothetical protein F5H01DRAFT_338151 [Linnemannia elongata]